MVVTAMSTSLVEIEESRSSDTPWVDNATRKCPDPEVRFYLYTRTNVDEKQLVYIDDAQETSNLSSSNFNPNDASKIIIHGFRSDMFLTPLFQMKTGELRLR